MNKQHQMINSKTCQMLQFKHTNFKTMRLILKLKKKEINPLKCHNKCLMWVTPRHFKLLKKKYPQRTTSSTQLPSGNSNLFDKYDKALLSQFLIVKNTTLCRIPYNFPPHWRLINSYQKWVIKCPESGWLYKVFSKVRSKTMNGWSNSTWSTPIWIKSSTSNRK
jgi:hypothetical protein